jgi:hypothetical protein
MMKFPIMPSVWDIGFKLRAQRTGKTLKAEGAEKPIQYLTKSRSHHARA